jgi:hypothetical protein
MIDWSNRTSSSADEGTGTQAPAHDGAEDLDNKRGGRNIGIELVNDDFESVRER